MLFCGAYSAWVRAGGGGRGEGRSPCPQWSSGWRHGTIRQGEQRQPSFFRAVPAGRRAGPPPDKEGVGLQGRAGRAA